MERPAFDDLMFFTGDKALAESVQEAYNKHKLSKLLKMRFCSYQPSWSINAVNGEEVMVMRNQDANEYLLLTRGRQFWKLMLHDALYFEKDLSPGYMLRKNHLFIHPDNPLKAVSCGTAKYVYEWHLVFDNHEPEYETPSNTVRLDDYTYTASNSIPTDIGCVDRFVLRDLEKLLDTAYDFFLKKYGEAA